jgi:hypothetical protein
VLLGIPAGFRRGVPFVEQEPVVLAVGLVPADEDEAALQLLAVQVEVQLTAPDGFGRIDIVGRFPSSPETAPCRRTTRSG